MTLKTIVVSLLKQSSLFCCIAAVSLMIGCTPQGNVSSSAGNYSEDLTQYRPEVKSEEPDTNDVGENEIETVEFVAPTEHLKTEIDSVVALTTAYNKKKNAITGYTIQVYTGISRDDANRAQVRVYGVLGEASPWIDYRQPVYKVKVGKFYSKLEANELFKQLKSEFPNALLIPQKFRIK